ncbi:MAG: AbiV family abortive infection protein [Candidatus Bathyarchaeota archaeon]|nr:MAG: AbiV family abortive infection protein [Candidatus Bathyarchaeota archaeon]
MTSKTSLYTKATKMSLENAEQWIKDATFLLGNSSFGHASALLRFAWEELAKAFLCWLSAEEIFPIENKVVRDAFKNHETKIQVIFGVFYTIAWRGQKPSQVEPSDREITKAYKQLKHGITLTNRMRQKATYVDILWEKNQIQTLLTITKKEANGILKLTELLLSVVRQCFEWSEPVKDKFRQAFAKYPKEVWETGRMPTKLFEEEE